MDMCRSLPETITKKNLKGNQECDSFLGNNSIAINEG